MEDVRVGADYVVVARVEEMNTAYEEGIRNHNPETHQGQMFPQQGKPIYMYCIIHFCGSFYSAYCCVSTTLPHRTDDLRIGFGGAIVDMKSNWVSVVVWRVVVENNRKVAIQG